MVGSGECRRKGVALESETLGVRREGEVSRAREGQRGGKWEGRSGETDKQGVIEDWRHGLVYIQCISSLQML